MQHQLLGALGLAQRAGALAVGCDAVCTALAQQRAALVLFAQDVSPNTQKRVQRAVQKAVPLLPAAPAEKRVPKPLRHKAARRAAQAQAGQAALQGKGLAAPPAGQAASAPTAPAAQAAPAAQKATVPVRTLPLQQLQLADALRKAVGVLAVTDANLAALCLSALTAQ